MRNEQEFLAAIAGLEHREITVTLPALSAWMAISALQLATRHPDFPASIRPYVVQVVQTITGTLEPDWNGPLSELIAMGWDAANDVVVRKG